MEADNQRGKEELSETISEEDVKNDSDNDEDFKDNNNKASIIQCNYCDNIFSFEPSSPPSKRKAQQLKHFHMKREHGSIKLNCSLCTKSFWTEKQLEEHVLNHKFKSNDEGNFQCEHCEYKCQNVARIKQHVNQVHLGLRPFLCDYCSSSFPTKSAVNIHRMSHTGERNYPCMFCEKKFNRKDNLVKHVRTHTGEKPFSCDVCGRTFGDQSHFAKHRMTHTDDGVKKFLCEICNKSYTRKAELKYHMWSHDTDQDGKRANYNREFKIAAIERTKVIGLLKTAEEMKINLSTLKTWVRLTVHPHNCEYCDNGYPYRAQLKKHLLTHPQYREQNGLQKKVQQQNQKYDENFRIEVAIFAFQCSIKEATIKYNLPHSTVNYWVKLLIDPRPCHLCGEEFAIETTLKRHLKEVHNNSSEGENLKRDKTFAMFLAQKNMLPSKDEIQAREEETQRKEQEKQNIAAVAKQFFEKEKEGERLKLEAATTFQEVDDKDFNLSKEVIEGNDEFKEDGDVVKEDVDEFKENDDEVKEEGGEVKEESDYIDLDEFLEEENGDIGNNVDMVDDKVGENEENENFVTNEGDVFESNIVEPDNCFQAEDDSSNELDDTDNKSLVQKVEPNDENGNKKKQNKKKLNKKKKLKKKKQKMRKIKKETQIKVERKVKETVCDYCERQFKETIQLKHHQLRKHRKELEEKSGVPATNFPCTECGKVFYIKKDVNEHFAHVHGPKKPPKNYKYLCTECGKEFKAIDTLTAHQAAIHKIGLKQNSHECTHCGKVYYQKHVLRRHINVVHEMQRVQCESCQKTFCDRNALSRHLLYHGEPKFQCDECPEKFRESMHLKRHKRVHAGEISDENTCEICNKQMASLPGLIYHQRMYHDMSGKISVCNDCGRQYETSKLLKAHMRIHTKAYKEKRYTCETCGKVYKSSVNLLLHFNTIHLGQRHFSCQTCQKLFTRASSLNAHKKLHDGLKQFHCIYCNVACREKRNLMNHITKNHPGSDKKFKRITPNGEEIMEKNPTHHDE